MPLGLAMLSSLSFEFENKLARFAQVLSVVSITKLSRSFIDHRRSTVILQFLWQRYSLKRFGNLQFCKGHLNDRTVKVNIYLERPYFSASNGEFYNSLSSFWIFECIPRILCIWDPNVRTVKVDGTYLKSLTFPASNGKCCKSLSSIWNFECITRIFGIWDPNVRIVTVDTYVKSLTFSASNGKCCNSHSSFWISECIPRNQKFGL